MKKIAILILFMMPVVYTAVAETAPNDTTFRYNDMKVVVSEKYNRVNVSVYHQNEEGDMEQGEKVYEAIFTDNQQIERRYDNNFEISIPEIFKPKDKNDKPKKKYRASHAHWAGFGLGFANLPRGVDYDGELSSIINISKSLQYNLNPFEISRRLGSSNITAISGMGIQFNSIHWQNNKAIKVEDYVSVVTTTAPGEEYWRSRLHYTYLTFPLLLETSWSFGSQHFFINGGLVAKVKTASSSRVWWTDDNGETQKNRFQGDLNIRPVTLDFIAQAGMEYVGFFISYSPYTLFDNNRGPKANQTTVGLQLHF